MKKFCPRSSKSKCRWSARKKSSAWSGKSKNKSIRWSRWASARAATRSGEDNVVAPILEKLGYKLERAKTNIGLGRITNTRQSDAMTNTLHRFGSAESFHDDYVVFAIASKGKNDEGAIEKLRQFLQLAVRSNR